MVSFSSILYAALNLLLILVCFLYLLVRLAFNLTWYCIKTPLMFCYYFCLGVYNFVVLGKANVVEDARLDSKELRGEGQGFTEELPKSTEESISRLLRLTKQDAYSVLGVAHDAAQIDIKKTYRQQAILVHPDKTQHPGADAAFKILVQAFEAIGDPEKRKEYDESLGGGDQIFAQNMDEMMTKLYEMYSNTLPCAGCNGLHKIKPLPEKKCERYCDQCRDYHKVKHNDIWAETSYLGYYMSYMAMRHGVVYNVSDWILCQNVKIVPNTHLVQCTLRGNSKTFDELVEEWKEEQQNGGKKSKGARRNQGNQQEAPPAESSSKTPSGKSTSRKSRKKRKK